MWAVVVEGTDDFWLDAFYEEKEAINFCKNKGLKII